MANGKEKTRHLAQLTNKITFHIFSSSPTRNEVLIWIMKNSKQPHYWALSAPLPLYWEISLPPGGNIYKNNTRALESLSMKLAERLSSLSIVIARCIAYETGSTCVSLCKVAQSTFLSPRNRGENTKPQNDYVITYLRTTNKRLYVVRGYFLSIPSWVIHTDVSVTLSEPLVSRESKYVRHLSTGVQLSLARRDRSDKLWSEETTTLIFISRPSRTLYSGNSRPCANHGRARALFSAENFLNVPSRAVGRSVRNVRGLPYEVSPRRDI